MPYERVDPFTTVKGNIAGSNIGNMLFQESVVKSLSLPDYELSSNGLNVEHADRINDSCDMLVLPFANQFRPEFAGRLDAATETIRRLKVPVVVVGIGCQTDLDYDFTRLEPMNGVVQRFVAAVLDRSASIGVRGECTAAYLNSLGFTDVEVIGCPSMFLDGPTFKRPRQLTTFTRATRLSVNLSANGEQAKFSTGLDKMGEMITRVVSTYDDVEYLPQQSNSLSAMLLPRFRHTNEHQALSTETYQTLRDQGRVICFVDPRPWLAHLATREFVFGTRLHGGIAALLAATPAHIIAHDSRTLELARYHGIPHTSIRDVSPELDPHDLYQSSDYSTIVRGHDERFANYAGFLRKNGLRNVFTDGDGGAAFEATMSAAVLTPGVSAATSWLQRLKWLGEHLSRKTTNRHARTGAPAAAI